MTERERKEHLYDKFGEFLPPELCVWLETTDFFRAPASTKYHGTNPGDLFNHSVGVANTLLGFTNAMGLIWENSRSPVIVGICHDACKFNAYRQIGGFSGHEEAKWDYRSDDDFPGHGEKSIQMLATHIHLTEEELFCIRYHMGAFVDQKEWQYYSKACKKYPNVLWTHTADMYVAQCKGL